MQITKPRAIPILYDNNTKTGWVVHGSGRIVTGFSLDKALQKWYGAHLNGQISRSYVFREHCAVLPIIP